MDAIEKRARELVAAEHEARGFKGHANRLREGLGPDSNPDRMALNAVIAALTRPDGHVVVTRNEAGQVVAVTRQDDEGRILSVIAEFEPPDGYAETVRDAERYRYIRSIAAGEPHEFGWIEEAAFVASNGDPDQFDFNIDEQMATRSEVKP